MSIFESMFGVEITLLVSLIELLVKDMTMIYPFVAVCLAGFALIQAIVGFVSYKRTGRNKLLLISLAFCVFTVKGIYALISVYTTIRPLGIPELSMLILDFLIVTLLYMSILKE